jgi:hypothetical protein
MTRRQRRAQAQTQNKIHSVDDIPYSHPSSDSPKPAKTLFELAEERRAHLQPSSAPYSPLNPQNVVNVKIHQDGTISHLDQPPLETPWLDTLLFSLSLSALHFTLETLTVHQYAQELLFGPITQHTLFLAFPVLTLLIHLFHGHLLPHALRESIEGASEKTRSLLYALRQLLLLGMATVSGCYLIYVCNDRGYYAVMKNAPSVGTLWVWSVLELGLTGAVLGVLGPAGWARWNGYSLT